MRHVTVVCDNTMGIPGGEIDDGLALLYLLGCPDRVQVDALCATHGNDTCERTFSALGWLARELRCEAPVLRGMPAGADGPDDAARAIVAAGRKAAERREAKASDAAAAKAQDADGGAEACHGQLQAGRTGASCARPQAAKAGASCARPQADGTGVGEGKPDGDALLSLGATTDLAAAERIEPGTLARFSEVCLMGGITRPLVVGARIMDELNLSVDAPATCAVLACARKGARLVLADAHGCLPLTFNSQEFLGRLAAPGMAGAELIRHTCKPWMDHARTAWDVDGFVGWDVLAAVELAHPELVERVPWRVTVDMRLVGAGLIAEANQEVPDCLAADVELVRIPDPAGLAEHVYQAWERGLARLA